MNRIVIFLFICLIVVDAHDEHSQDHSHTKDDKNSHAQQVKTKVHTHNAETSSPHVHDKEKLTKTSSTDFTESDGVVTLSPDHIRRIFEKYDTNGDGLVKLEEFREKLLDINLYLTASDLESMKKHLDLNSDGAMDLDQFTDMIRIYFLMDGTSAKEFIRKSFNVYDEDKNGLIDPAELKRVLHILGYNNYGTDECTKMIQARDLDHDGFVNYPEYEFMMLESESFVPI